KKHCDKPIYVMIRPRGGDFNYSDSELDVMKKQILEFKNVGANGFVFGILDHDHNINVAKNKALIELADNLPCTLHRAFDRGNSLNKNLEDAISCGFTTILTSGMQPSVDLGKENLKSLVELAGDKIHILVGGGLRSTNIYDIKSYTSARHFHSS